MAQKPSIPKGTRDFSPQEMLRRKYIFNTIERVFQKYGFLPLETPAMENLETLTGKYGEEGDRLIFKILKRGADLDRAVQEGSKSLAAEALRYDLTVPFARYVVQNQHEITFPFKRYQIQPVWRADRPQKGRYREFYQCDADVIGSKSLLNEVDLVLLIVEVFQALNLNVKIMVNNRKALFGFAQYLGVEDRAVEFITKLDKQDKIGDRIFDELLDEEFPASAVEKARMILSESILGDYESRVGRFDYLMELFVQNTNDLGREGLQEVRFVLDSIKPHLPRTGPGLTTEFNIALARGLDYYTGAIFEVKALEGSLQSSICGGGRYDDLTGIFGLKNMSGVGISFGADRIYDVLLETGKFPAELGGSTKLLFANFGEAEAMHCLRLLRTVREAGIPAELYPDAVKMAKQFKYADDKGIPYVAIIGENELKQGIVTVKDMKSGEQKAVEQDALIDLLR
ncbi:MAG: histidine--tRNA ligase [Flavobacteriales bacterium]|nr:histidine--tRNA ligase [Flavobacteriales bacterium]MCB9178539.1 histidine--tRNA ligase [Flavobacteriales bacterium]